MQGVSYTADGMRDTRQSMTCNLPRQILQLHNQHVNFDAIRPADSDFSKLPPGGAVQTYTVSVSNNGRVFGSSQTFSLLFNNTCMSCDDTGPIQLVSQLIISVVFSYYLLHLQCVNYARRRSIVIRIALFFLAFFVFHFPPFGSPASSPWKQVPQG